MFEKSCQCQVHRTWYRLHASSPEAEVSTYSTEFDGSQDFSNTLLRIEELSVTLDLDSGSIINRFFATLYSATQSKTEAS
jgi:hypothetical protein